MVNACAGLVLTHARWKATFFRPLDSLDASPEDIPSASGSLLKSRAWYCRQSAFAVMLYAATVYRWARGCFDSHWEWCRQRIRDGSKGWPVSHLKVDVWKQSFMFYFLNRRILMGMQLFLLKLLVKIGGRLTSVTEPSLEPANKSGVNL